MLIGGARSGKSSLGQRLAASAAHERSGVSVIATAEAGDREMTDRIARHRSDRPSGWVTVEAPRDLADAIADVDPDHVLLLDCLTLWVANRVMADATEDELAVESEEIAAAIDRRRTTSIIVTNEVGQGIVPADAVSRLFRDAHGRANAVLAAACDHRFLVVAGQIIPLTAPDAIFGPLRRPGEGIGSDRS